MGQHFSKLNESTLSAFGLNRRIETASGRIRFWFSGQNERRRPMATLCDVATSTFAICRSLAPPSKWLCVGVSVCTFSLGVCDPNWGHGAGFKHFLDSFIAINSVNVSFHYFAVSVIFTLLQFNWFKILKFNCFQIYKFF